MIIKKATSYRFLALLLVLLPAPGAPAQAKTGSGTVTLEVSAWPQVKDPLQADGRNSVRVRLVHEPLLTFRGPLELDLGASLVSEYRVLGEEPAEKTTATPAAPPLALKFADGSAPVSALELVLKPDLAFHDGTPVDAAAVKASLDRAQPHLVGEAPGAPRVEVQVADLRTVRILLSRPYGPYLTLLASTRAALVKPAGEKLLGTGLFEEEPGTEPGQEVLLKVSSHARTPPRGIQQVRLIPARPGMGQVARLLCGRSQGIQGVEERYRRVLPAASGLTVVRAPGRAWLYMAFHLTDEWMASQRLREILIRGIDGWAFSSTLPSAEWQAAVGIFPEGSLPPDKEFSQLYKIAFDPGEARRLVTLEGLDGAGLILRVGILDVPSPFKLEEAGVESLLNGTLEPLNMSCLVQKFSAADLSRMDSARLPQVLLFPVTLSWLDLDGAARAFTELFEPPPGQNPARPDWRTHYGFCAAALRDAQKKAQAESQPLARQFLYSELSNLLARDLAGSLLGHEDRSWSLSPRLKGARVSPDGELDLSGARLDP